MKFIEERLHYSSYFLSLIKHCIIDRANNFQQSFFKQDHPFFNKSLEIFYF